MIIDGPFSKQVQVNPRKDVLAKLGYWHEQKIMVQGYFYETSTSPITVYNQWQEIVGNIHDY